MKLELPILESGHINRCFHMRYSKSYSTCFLHSNNDKAAFVTTAHSLSGVEAGDRIMIRSNSEWIPFEISEIVIDKLQDIAVFTLNMFKISALWHEPQTEMFLAQPVVYLGFPHSLSGDYPGQMDMATPLAKTANFSGNINIGGANLMVLDGVNNPGFSGGPIFHNQAISDDPKIGIVGIVHGYRYEQEEQGRVYRKSGTDGKDTVPTEYFVRLNSGMILASPRRYIDDLFEKLPQGLVVAKAE